MKFTKYKVNYFKVDKMHLVHSQYHAPTTCLVPKHFHHPEGKHTLQEESPSLLSRPLTITSLPPGHFISMKSYYMCLLCPASLLSVTSSRSIHTVAWVSASFLSVARQYPIARLGHALSVPLFFQFRAAVNMCVCLHV